MYKNSQCKVYRMFKSEIKLEKYLVEFKDKDRVILSKFRCRNHKFPVTGNRFTEVDQNELKCDLCNRNDLGDEFHYLLECPHFQNERKEYLGRPCFNNKANVYVVYSMFNDKKTVKIKKYANS